VALSEYARRELRYTMLARAHPEESARLMGLAQEIVNQKWETSEEMASRAGSHFHPVPAGHAPPGPASPARARRQP
jgi:pyruvate-ferredoxin/flavodoxin oxidoreductase